MHLKTYDWVWVCVRECVCVMYFITPQNQDCRARHIFVFTALSPTVFTWTCSQQGKPRITASVTAYNYAISNYLVSTSFQQRVIIFWIIYIRQSAPQRH